MTGILRKLREQGLAAAAERAGSAPPSVAVTAPTPAITALPPLPDDLQPGGNANTHTTLSSAEAYQRARTRFPNHSVILDGTKVFVAYDGTDPEIGQACLKMVPTDEFVKLYAHEKVSVNGKPLSIAKVFLDDPNRLQYPGGVALLPDEPVPPGVKNLWTGFAYQPAPGPVSASDVQPMLDFLHHVIADGNMACTRYLLGWQARGYQYPGKQAEVAVVAQGEQGVGKGTLGRYFLEPFGRHGMHIAQSRQLSGNFNGHLRQCCALFADEAFFAGDRAGLPSLKALITEPVLTLEQKFRDAAPARNRLKIIMATNETHAIIAGTAERRFFVLTVSSRFRQNHAYFDALNRWWESGGKEKWLAYLLAMDISKFNIRRVPNTKALEEQKLASLPPVGRWLHDRLTTGGMPGEAWSAFAPCETVVANFGEWVRANGQRHVEVSARSVGSDLRTYIDIERKREPATPRRWGWTFPPLADARRQFSAKVGLEHSLWDDDTETDGNGDAP